MSKERLTQLLQEASNDILKADSSVSLDRVRSLYLGKNCVLTEMLKDIHNLPKESRREFGQEVNNVKEKIQSLLLEQAEKIKAEKVLSCLNLEAIDVTMPPRGNGLGSLHPITRIRNEIEEFFIGIGFEISEGPEIEDNYHNFDALNVEAHHPSRYMQDTFYFQNDLLLRTHTSPVQIRTMENGKPPFRIIAPGRVYRCDFDATHSPMFHQVEGLVVDEGISFANLKWIVRLFIEHFFTKNMKFRFRASYFPFTEPSAEVDLLWTNASGQSKWLEVMGCGMVHPNVLRNVGVDSEKYSGFAFGMGLDRLAMLLYGVDDLRMFFENDIRFLEQF